jgi:hypothetical protein
MHFRLTNLWVLLLVSPSGAKVAGRRQMMGFLHALPRQNMTLGTASMRALRYYSGWASLAGALQPTCLRTATAFLDDAELQSSWVPGNFIEEKEVLTSTALPLR